MATSPLYVFPGMAPYVERAAQARGADAVHMVKSMALWHVTQVQNALGQIPRLSREQRPDLLAHAVKIRECLAAVLAGVDDAIEDVRLNNGLVPAADRKPIRLRDDDESAATTPAPTPAAVGPRPSKPIPGRGKPAEPAA